MLALAAAGFREHEVTCENLTKTHNTSRDSTTTKSKHEHLNVESRDSNIFCSSSGRLLNWRVTSGLLSVAEFGTTVNSRSGPTSIADIKRGRQRLEAPTKEEDLERDRNTKRRSSAVLKTRKSTASTEASAGARTAVEGSHASWAVRLSG